MGIARALKREEGEGGGGGIAVNLCSLAGHGERPAAITLLNRREKGETSFNCLFGLGRRCASAATAGSFGAACQAIAAGFEGFFGNGSGRNRCRSERADVAGESHCRVVK